MASSKGFSIFSDSPSPPRVRQQQQQQTNNALQNTKGALDEQRSRKPTLKAVPENGQDLTSKPSVFASSKPRPRLISNNNNNSSHNLAQQAAGSTIAETTSSLAQHSSRALKLPEILPLSSSSSVFKQQQHQQGALPSAGLHARNKNLPQHTSTKQRDGLNTTTFRSNKSVRVNNNALPALSTNSKKERKVFQQHATPVQPTLPRVSESGTSIPVAASPARDVDFEIYESPDGNIVKKRTLPHSQPALESESVFVDDDATPKSFSQPVFRIQDQKQPDPVISVRKPRLVVRRMNVRSESAINVCHSDNNSAAAAAEQQQDTQLDAAPAGRLTLFDHHPRMRRNFSNDEFSTPSHQSSRSSTTSNTNSSQHSSSLGGFAKQMVRLREVKVENKRLWDRLDELITMESDLQAYVEELEEKLAQKIESFGAAGVLAAVAAVAE